MRFPFRTTLIVLALGTSVCPAQPLRLIATAPHGDCPGLLEWQIEGVGEAADPFDPGCIEVEVQVEQGGKTWRVPAFFMQDYERRRVDGRDWFYPRGLPGWRARAAASADEGRARAVVRDARGTRRSEAVHFSAPAMPHRGFLRVSRRDPRWLELDTGEPFFAIGQNLAFIGSQQYFTVSRAEAALAELAAHGANYVRLWACCGDWALALEAPKSAWGRSWGPRPPVVPLPDRPDRRGVWLTNAVTAVEPSHEVALRPATRYVVRGRLRATSGATVRLEVQGTVSPNLAPEAPDTWATFEHEFTTGEAEYWLRGMRFRREGAGTAWLADLSLKEAAGGPELLWEAEVNRPRRGFYNPLDAFWLDELLAAAQRHGVYVQVCLLTRDLYMSALKDPASPDYDRAIADARKTFRYAVARWGAFASLGAWEYWNEMDPGLPTERFYTELGTLLEETDPWRHLRATSTWGPSPNDYRHPKLDIADVHFYYKPVDHARWPDEVEAILDRARWLREHAPDKPAGYGNTRPTNRRCRASAAWPTTSGALLTR